MSGDYCIAEGYVGRDKPEYFHDDVPGDLVWQPDVYSTVDRLARRIGSSRVIDIGAGRGDKLAEIGATEKIALDFGDNLQLGQDRQSGIDWRRYDAEHDDSLPVSPGELQNSMLVCADVIEHLPRPERLIGNIRDALSGGAAGCVLSTPDRVRTHGLAHGGPPPNAHHVREWTREELVAFLRREGLATGAAGWTRSHRYALSRNTILVILADAPTLQRGRVTAKPVSGAFTDIDDHMVQQVQILARTSALWLARIPSELRARRSSK